MSYPKKSKIPKTLKTTDLISQATIMNSKSIPVSMLNNVEKLRLTNLEKILDFSLYDIMKLLGSQVVYKRVK